MTKLQYEICEACDNGDIDLDTRDSLLNITLEHALHEINNDDELFTEGFATFKSVKAAKLAADAAFGKIGGNWWKLVQIAEKEMLKLSVEIFVGTFVVGAALAVSVKTYMKSRLSNYEKLHDDLIPFKEFTKERFKADEAKKFGIDCKWDDSAFTSSHVYIYSHKKSKKKAFAIATSMVSLDTFNTSGNFAFTAGPKKVHMQLLDNKLKPYEDYYNACMAYKHDFFHPCLKRFINVAKSEWKEYRDEVKKLQKIEEERKSSKTTKESVDELKMEIYESELAGKITAEERRDLILRLESTCDDKVYKDGDHVDIDFFGVKLSARIHFYNVEEDEANKRLKKLLKSQPWSKMGMWSTAVNNERDWLENYDDFKSAKDLVEQIKSLGSRAKPTIGVCVNTHDKPGNGVFAYYATECPIEEEHGFSITLPDDKVVSKKTNNKKGQYTTIGYYSDFI